jgi:hypothetical protein
MTTLPNFGRWTISNEFECTISLTESDFQINKLNILNTIDYLGDPIYEAFVSPHLLSRPRIDVMHFNVAFVIGAKSWGIELNHKILAKSIVVQLINLIELDNPDE